MTKTIPFMIINNKNDKTIIFSLIFFCYLKMLRFDLFLYIRFVASPPLICLSSKLRSSTFLTFLYKPKFIFLSLYDTSKCTVLLLTPNSLLACLIVHLCLMIYFAISSCLVLSNNIQTTFLQDICMSIQLQFITQFDIFRQIDF